MGIVQVLNLSHKPLKIKSSSILARGKPTREANLKEINVMSINHAFKESQQLPIDQITVMGDKLSETDKKRVIDILNESRDCFALELSELVKTKIAKLRSIISPIEYHTRNKVKCAKFSMS